MVSEGCACPVLGSCCPPRGVSGIRLHLADLSSAFLWIQARSQPYLWREVLALAERVVSFTEQTFVSVKNAIWSPWPRTLLGWVTTWQGERVPPDKCRCGSFPFQRPWTTPKVRPAPLSSRAPAAPLFHVAFSSSPQFCRDAVPGLSLGAAPHHYSGWTGSSTGASAWEAAEASGSLWRGQIVALPNRGVAKLSGYQMQGLRRYGW